MNNLSGTDGSQVAVALIGEYGGAFGGYALNTGGYSGSTAVGGFVHIACEVVISKYGAADGGNANGGADNAQLFQSFCNQLMGYAMGAAGAVMEFFIR